MARHNTVQIIKVVIIIAGRPQNLEGHIANDRRSTVIQKQKLPLHAVFRSELITCGINNAHFPDQLGILYASSAHENQLFVHLGIGILLEDARQHRRLSIWAIRNLRTGTRRSIGIVT